MKTQATLNGNKLVKTEHIFVPGEGCFYRTMEQARKEGVGPNAAGTWIKTIEFGGSTWYQMGQVNAWD